MSLSQLDPRKLRLLRSENHAEMKNDLMMERLWKEDWFVSFRRALDAYREDGGPRPDYPSKLVEFVESEVDEWIRENVDRSYTR